MCVCFFPHVFLCGLRNDVSDRSLMKVTRYSQRAIDTGAETMKPGA